MENNTSQAPKEKSRNKYLIAILIVVGIILGFSGYIVGRYSNKTTQVNQKKRPPTADSLPLIKEERPIYKLSAPVMSPDNGLVLQLKSEEIGENYSLNLFIDKFPHPHRPITYLDGVEVENAVLMNFTGDRDKLEQIFGYFSSYVSWLSTRNSFALLLPDKVVIYDYLTEPVKNDTYSPPRISVTLTKTHEFAIDEDFDRFDHPVLLFSGNGKELFYSSKLGIRKLMPEEKMIETQDGYYPSSIYPIPNSSGIAYWVNIENEVDDNNHYFVTDFGTSSKIYTLTSDFSVDYYEEIILSPDLQKVCIGWRSSGSGGKILFDLATGKQIESGTGCVRWINNNEVVVYSSDSSGGGESGNIVYYLVNLSTDNKTLLHNYYAGR